MNVDRKTILLFIMVTVASGGRRADGSPLVLPDAGRALNYDGVSPLVYRA